MRIPADETGAPKAWTKLQANDGLLYFVQLVDELVSHQSPEALRAVSLDSYHRLLEFERIWDESVSGGFGPDMGTPMAELLEFLGRDPVVTTDHADLWKAVEPLLRSAADRPEAAVEAARLFSQKLRATYLRRCRSYLEKSVGAGKAKNKREFRYVVENYCSFLINMGFSPNSIYYHLTVQFFEGDPGGNSLRELQKFFSKFPHSRESEHTVGFAVSDQLGELLSTRSEFAQVEPGHRIHVRRTTFPGTRPKHVYALTIPALDATDARARGETYLTQIRSVAYTVMPYADLRWHPHVVVVDSENRSVVLREQLDLIRQGRWLTRGRTTELESRLQFFLDGSRPPEDKNRLVNAVTSYASAFHSESRSSQLVSLWSCLEGILPAPTGGGSRISSFVRNLRGPYERLYLMNRLETLDFDITGAHRSCYPELLARVVSSRQDTASRLLALMCFPANDGLREEIGKAMSTNPLGRQRLFELHAAGKHARDLYGLVANAGQKAEWQLRRIYRERNRIVHRAEPSGNIDTLIQNLNSYILILFDALRRVAARPGAGSRLDDLFAEMRILEEARQRRVASLGEEALTEENIGMVLGPEA